MLSDPHPSQARKPRIFWDSSAIISAVFTRKPDSEARQLLQLGDLGFVDMRYCREVGHRMYRSSFKSTAAT